MVPMVIDITIIRISLQLLIQDYGLLMKTDRGRWFELCLIVVKPTGIAND